MLRPPSTAMICPVDVGRVPGEEQRRAGDILGAAVTLQGGLADDLAFQRLVHAVFRPKHRPARCR